MWYLSRVDNYVDDVVKTVVAGTLKWRLRETPRNESGMTGVIVTYNNKYAVTHKYIHESTRSTLWKWYVVKIVIQ